MTTARDSGWKILSLVRRVSFLLLPVAAFFFFFLACFSPLDRTPVRDPR